MNIHSIPFVYNGKSYDLDVHESGKDFVIMGPHVITLTLGASKFEFRKKQVGGAKTLLYNPASDLANHIASVLLIYWN